MKNKWFLIRIGYTKQMENGGFSRVQESYMVSADCYCSAENRMIEESKAFVRGELSIRSIQEKPIVKVFTYEDSAVWYLVVIRYQLVDADTEKPKNINQQFLVSAHSVKEAYERIVERLADEGGEYNDLEVRKTTSTTIEEIFWPTKEEIEKAKVDADAAK